VNAVLKCLRRSQMSELRDIFNGFIRSTYFGCHSILTSVFDTWKYESRCLNAAI